VRGAHKFLDALRPYTVIADTVSLTQDFTHLKSLNREDQQKQLRELAVRGQTIRHVRRPQPLRLQLRSSKGAGGFFAE
jgi:hypothetical protein